MSLKEKVEQFQEKLGELETALQDAVQKAREVASEAEMLGLPRWVDAQLEMYLARNVESFIENEHQIGSITSIKAGLEDEADMEQLEAELEQLSEEEDEEEG